MIKPSRRAAAAAFLALAAMTASAVDNVWNGPYAGFNAGQGSSRLCTTWGANGPSAESATLAGLYRSGCGHSGFLGGGQIGDNFQTRRLTWGVDAGLDFWESGNSTQTAKFEPSPTPAGGPPAGTYSFTGRQSPNVLGLFTARIGYAGNQWLPYLKAGGLLAGGSQANSLHFVPEGTTAAKASFDGSRSFASAGWVAGGGAEFGLHGSWSIAAEYLHASLGKGSSSTAGCAGSASNCAPFASASLQNGHGSFEANLIRITINYWFDFW